MEIKKRLKKNLSIPKLSFRDSTQKAALAVSLVVLGLGILVSFVFSKGVSTAQTIEYENKQRTQIDLVDKHLSSTISSYEAILVSASAIFKVSSTVTSEEWGNLYKNLRLESRNPEILGIGYAEYVQNTRLSEHINSVRTSGYPEYNFTPPETRSEYVVVRYLEPSSEANKKTIGFDMQSESTRTTATKRALETQESTLSGPVLAVQDIGRTDGRKPQSLIIYYPVFLGKSDTQNSVSNILGYVYIIFRADDVFSTRKELSGVSNSGLTITDTTTSPEPVYEKSKSHSDSKTTTKEVSVASRKWLLSAETASLSRTDRSTPLVYFMIGTILSTFISSYLFMVLSRRSFEITAKHSKDLQSAKNDLLALASHQLRTPASGARQYMSMLMNGFFGELNPEQKDVARKAYAANNRQLEIIDLLLCVAKADAGQLMIEKVPIELVSVVTRIIESFKDAADAKNIDIYYHGRKKLQFSGDDKYVTMMIENLVSNAVKYSYPDSKVRINVKKDKGSLYLKITDSGVGVDVDDQKYLFEKFKRINNPLSKNVGGSGLGLYLARKIARAHGGDILAVSSDTQKGSSFELTLPIDDEVKNVAQLT